jgi:hypothetical protein
LKRLSIDSPNQTRLNPNLAISISNIPNKPTYLPLTMFKVILITGANRGIGFCIAQSLAQQSSDCCILLASRDISSAEKAIANIPNPKAALQPIALDVTSDESIKACLDEIKERHGKLDGVSHSHFVNKRSAEHNGTTLTQHEHKSSSTTQPPPQTPLPTTPISVAPTTPFLTRTLPPSRS